MSRKSRISGTVPAAAVLIAVGLAACGTEPTTGPSAVEPASSATTVVVDQTFDAVEAGGQRMVDFTLPHRGSLALTVHWNDQTNSVVATLAGTGCFNFRNPTADCQVRRSIDRQGREGREGVIDYPNAGGAYQLVVENEGPGTESIRVTAELTSYVPPTPATPAPTAPPDRNRPTPRRSWEP
jgi:hypothetical protein